MPERPGIVHRLDRDTSGLLVVSRTEEAYRGLRNLVRRRALERRYKALVRGRPRSWRGRVEAPIGRDRHEPTRVSLDTDTPRDAITHFEVEELLDGYALLDVRLETGRTHQIRVHLAAIGLPVVGDRAYGVPDPELARQFLHAWRLAFPHPVSGEQVEVESPLPAGSPGGPGPSPRPQLEFRGPETRPGGTGRVAVPARWSPVPPDSRRRSAQTRERIRTCPS